MQHKTWKSSRPKKGRGGIERTTDQPLQMYWTFKFRCFVNPVFQIINGIGKLHVIERKRVARKAFHYHDMHLSSQSPPFTTIVCILAKAASRAGTGVFALPHPFILYCTVVHCTYYVQYLVAVADLQFPQDHSCLQNDVSSMTSSTKLSNHTISIAKTFLNDVLM
jgi:hypothetical protein